jgi:hypothetical protein
MRNPFSRRHRVVSLFVSKYEVWAIVYKTSFSIPFPSDENPVLYAGGKTKKEVLMYGTNQVVFVTQTTL